MEIVCKSCEFKWKQDKAGLLSICYCPNCGAIGYMDKEFEVAET